VRGTTVLTHPLGRVHLDELAPGRLRVVAETNDPSVWVQHRSCETSYPPSLVELILAVKGPRFVCDEIMRDEDPSYLHDRFSKTLLGYVPRARFEGATVLDFGCGSGASTVVLARMFPAATVVGVELVQEFLTIAEARAHHHGLDHVSFVHSPRPSELPAGLDHPDVVVLNGVYEHLLPHERPNLLGALWTHLLPGGVLFIDETPNRWFPVESHTTGLPLLNYLPDRMALAATQRLARKRAMGDASWETLLRKGIRGATGKEIEGILQAVGPAPTLMTPLGGDRVDLWYEGYARSSVARFGGVKAAMRFALKVLDRRGINLVPYLSLAYARPPGV
jgi:2-polyprenyl-3-methyl-5-hydroxy-6-metoxy-1,4-benzoquinol methylase